jgi:dTDP-4-amino-4,6-dideoxygalactose transaminase
MAEPMYVTRPALPPLEELEPLLREIWASGQVTNSGPMLGRLEAALAEYLGVASISVVANGTLALLLALRALEIEGEVITTPFSFVATTHALLWNGNRPVFADIDPETLNLDPEAVEAAITPRTRAILPVHVHGRPCDLTGLRAVAERHGLRLLYDAAHVFGVRLEAGNLLDAGDASVLSFHGTKVFHTFEGGAVVCSNPAAKRRVDLMRNFGFTSETEVVLPGLNAKMNEFQAALGLVQLRRIDGEIEHRRGVVETYRAAFETVPGLRWPRMPDGVERANHAYCAILVEHDFGIDRDELYRRLKRRGIHARRYFHPLISDFPMYRAIAAPAHLPVARATANAVLCLPIHSAMTGAETERVIDAVLSARHAP